MTKILSFNRKVNLGLVRVGKNRLRKRRENSKKRTTVINDINLIFILSAFFVGTIL
jgi:hypothetical protein